MLFEILCVVIFILLCYLYGTRNYNYFAKRSIKSPRTAPFVGNIWPALLGKHLVSLLKFGYSSFPNERYVGYYDFQNPWIWLRDNELIKQVCVKDYESFLDHVPALNDKVDLLYAQLLICLRGKKWKEMRSLMTPAFTSLKIKAMLPLIKECSNQMISYLIEELNKNKDKEYLEIETKDIFTRFANDVIASAAFGLRIDSLRERNNIFFKMGTKLTDTNIKFFLTYLLNYLMPSVVEFFGITLIDQTTGDYFKDIVMCTMKEREDKNIKRLDLIHLLIEAKKGSLSGHETDILPEDKHDLQYQPTTVKTNWTDNELTAQALIFFLAGFESVSTFLSFALYKLATRQDIQKKLLDEIDSVTSDSNENLYESIMTMKYMDMFVSEGLRLYPTLPMIDRQCNKECTFPPPNDESTQSYQVNPGDRLGIPIRSIHRDPRFFSDPLEFDPERFSEENKKNIKPFTYIPFGVGPRQCLGRRFALMEIKCALFFLLLHFTVVPTPKTKNPAGLPTKVISMVPLEGMWVGLKRRNKMNSLHNNNA